VKPARLVAIGGTAAAVALVAALAINSPALAQDEQPSCADALTAYVAAQADLDALPETVPNPALAELQAAVAEAKADVDAALPPVLTYSADVYPGDKVPASVEALTEATLRAILDDKDLGADARAQVQVALDAVLAHASAVAALDAAAAKVPNPARVDAQAKVDTARTAADDACRGPVGPTPTVAPTTTPAPNDDDLDCGDFPLSDGRTAQDVLDADPTDPHNLDSDGDQVACELDDLTSGDYTQVDQLPVAIDTGRA
jgi:hypothetical protein